ncbi:Uncharacterised protein [Mycobacteroides abscessus subsp. abscessus]|nr:Uncharacterised protein [Mycobacteroides abscessus subsp. abscessus]
MLIIKILLGILCVILVLAFIGLLISIFKTNDKKEQEGIYGGMAVCVVVFILSYNYITGGGSDKGVTMKEDTNSPVEKVSTNSSTSDDKENAKKYNTETGEWEDISIGSKSEANLELNIDNFKEKFNQAAQDTVLGDDGYFLGEFEIKDGSVNNGFYSRLTPAIEVMGSLNKSNELIKDLVILLYEDGSVDTGPYNLATIESVINIIDPSQDHEERLEILENLNMLDGMASILDSDGKTYRFEKNNKLYVTEYKTTGEYESRMEFWIEVSK